MDKKITLGLRNEKILKAKLKHVKIVPGPKMTCASCRFFGRDKEPIPADQTFDKNKRYICIARSGGSDLIIYPNAMMYTEIYVAADRPADKCPYFEEDNVTKTE